MGDLERQCGRYRRIGAQGGTWIAKLRITGAGRWLHALGPADDVLDTGGDILTFAQAQERARAWFAQQENAAASPLQLDETPTPAFTVADALDAYLAWFARHRKGLVATRSVIEAHIRPALGTIEAGKLTTGEIRRWHQTLADSPAMVRARRDGPRHFRERATDPEATRARKSTANRVLTVLKAALNHVWSHPPEDREAAVAAFDPETWRKVRAFRGADAARLRYLMVEKHYGHLAPSYLRDMVRRTALDLGPHDAGNVASLRPGAAK